MFEMQKLQCIQMICGVNAQISPLAENWLGELAHLYATLYDYTFFNWLSNNKVG
jgi:hypothetical protein